MTHKLSDTVVRDILLKQTGGQGMPEAVEFLKSESKDHPVDIFGKFQYKAGMVFDAAGVHRKSRHNLIWHSMSRTVLCLSR